VFGVWLGTYARRVIAIPPTLGSTPVWAKAIYSWDKMIIPQTPWTQQFVEAVKPSICTFCVGIDDFWPQFGTITASKPLGHV